MRVAVAQHRIVAGDVATNLATVVALVREALPAEPDIVVFPEEALAGYAPESPALAEHLEGGPTVARLQSELRGTHTRVLLGLTETDGSDRWITAVLVGAGGVVARYRKTHLWSDTPGVRHEPTHYVPGSELVTFEVAGQQCGVMICYDGDFPEMSRAYAGLGCSVVFWINNRHHRGPDETRHLAIANSLVIAASCFCGPDENGEHARGGSHVMGHDGTVLGELWDDSGLLIVDVDAAAAHSARAANPFYTGRRPDLYATVLAEHAPSTGDDLTS